jgi:predicted small secreted protein
VQTTPAPAPPPEPAPQAVFVDHSGRRGRRLRGLAWLVWLLCALFAAACVLTVSGAGADAPPVREAPALVPASPQPSSGQNL